jgi:hypothetical protein
MKLDTCAGRWFSSCRGTIDTAAAARLGIPIGSIGPFRNRCLDKLRRSPAIAALINAEAGSADPAAGWGTVSVTRQLSPGLSGDLRGRLPQRAGRTARS